MLACLFHMCCFTRVGSGRFRVPESIAIVFIVVCDNLQQMFGSFESQTVIVPTSSFAGFVCLNNNIFACCLLNLCWFEEHMTSL